MSEHYFESPQCPHEAIRAHLAEHTDEAAGAGETVKRVREAMAEPLNRWWHTGGTPCVPARVIRAALAGGASGAEGAGE